MPDLHQTSPAKIAAGFGGTLTLILSAMFVIAVVLPPAIPAYVMYAQASLAKPPGMDDQTPLSLVCRSVCSAV